MTQPIVPFDVWSLIICFLDYSSLKEFSVMNHELHLEVNKRLWRSISVGIPHDLRYRRKKASVAALQDFWDALRRNPGRAGHIRKLTLRVDDTSFVDEEGPVTIVGRFLGIFWQSSTEEPTLLTSLEVLGNILQVVGNITSLYIDQSIHRRGEVPSASVRLSEGNFPFTLTSFASTIATDDIFPFLRSQPGMKIYRSFQHTFDGYDWAPSMPKELLSSLESVTSTIPEVSRLTAGRPVHTIGIAPFMVPSDVATLKGAILSSTIHVTHLHLPTIHNGNLAHALTLLSNSLPQLRLLEAHIDGADLLLPVPRVNLVELVTTLQRNFPKLETLTFWDESRKGWPPGWKAAFIIESSANQPCTALRRVGFLVGGALARRGSVVLVRDSEGSKWEPETGCTHDIDNYMSEDLQSTMKDNHPQLLTQSLTSGQPLLGIMYLPRYERSFFLGVELEEQYEQLGHPDSDTPDSL